MPTPYTLIITTGNSGENLKTTIMKQKVKNLKLALLAVLVTAGLTSCVATYHPYGAHWVPGHYVPGYYHPHWVPGHWA